MINIGISVNEHIAEGNNSARSVMREAVARIHVRQLRQGFAAGLQLSLYCRRNIASASKSGKFLPPTNCSTSSLEVP